MRAPIRRISGLLGTSKKTVAEKEYPGQQSELLTVDGQLLVHRQRGKPDMDAIEECDDEKYKNKRNDSYAYLTNGARIDGR
jgi:hypothetical protein